MTVFSMSFRIGAFGLRPVNMPADAELLHRWLTDPKSSFWMMSDADLDTVRREFEGIEASTICDAFIGTHDDKAAFLMEQYDPGAELAAYYDHEATDVGMHFLVAPTDRPIHGFSHAVIRTVLAYLFSDPRTNRVVVEPDVRNSAVHALNTSVGFEIDRTITLPYKQAYLSICTREGHRRAVPDHPSDSDRSG